MRIWTITMQKEPSYSAGACSGSNSSQTRRWICHGKIGKTKGQCFRLCISCCRSPEKGKENSLKFKKNLHLPHACTQGVGQLLPREQSCDMLAGWSGRDRPNARWWASGCSSEGRQQADLELRRGSCEENTDRRWKKRLWLHIKEQSHCGKTN